MAKGLGAGGSSGRLILEVEETVVGCPGRGAGATVAENRREAVVEPPGDFRARPDVTPLELAARLNQSLDAFIGHEIAEPKITRLESKARRAEAPQSLIRGDTTEDDAQQAPAPLEHSVDPLDWELYSVTEIQLAQAREGGGWVHICELPVCVGVGVNSAIQCVGAGVTCILPD